MLRYDGMSSSPRAIVAGDQLQGSDENERLDGTRGGRRLVRNPGSFFLFRFLATDDTIEDRVELLDREVLVIRVVDLHHRAVSTGRQALRLFQSEVPIR